MLIVFFFFNDTATTEIYTLSLHDALPISFFIFIIGKGLRAQLLPVKVGAQTLIGKTVTALTPIRSEEHTSELQSRPHLVCRLLLEKKKKDHNNLLREIHHTTLLRLKQVPN